MATGEENFEAFWREYLRAHGQTGTRALHGVGTGLAVAALVAGLIMVNPLIVFAGVGLGYLCAWAGHFLVEHNRPAMASHPAWAFQCDIRMFRLMITGRLAPELVKAGAGGECGLAGHPDQQ
jgi:hypothetical protein